MKCIPFVLAMLILSSTAHAADATNYIVLSAKKYRVSAEFALRVAKVESGKRCAAVGQRGEVGPLQILPATARSIGYKNIRAASCQTKVDAGMKYLARCYHGAGGNWRRAAACHNAGEASLRWRKYPANVNRYVTKIVTR